MTSMLKIKNMAGTAGWEAEGVEENLVMNVMKRMIIKRRRMKMTMIMTTMMKGCCTSPARLSTTNL